MRRLLCLIALIVCLLVPAAASAHTFVVATDPHFISPELTDHGEYFMRMIEGGDGKIVHYCEELIDAFVQEMIAKKPDCVILSGDLTFNGAKKSHEDLAAKLRMIDQAGIPVYVMPGNHDVYSYAAASFSGSSYALVERTTSEDFKRIYHDLGFDAAIARDPYSLSYIAEPVPGVRILMLDVNTQFSMGAVAQNTFTWLNSVLAQAKTDGAKIIAVSHQNLYAHSSLLSAGFVIANAQMLASRYRNYDVAVNLSGHMHMQHTLAPQDGTPEIVTSSLAVSPCQYGVIETDGASARYHTEFLDVSAWAQANGKTDPNLLNFRAYAAAFFAATSLRQSPETLAALDDPNTYVTALSNINAAYFSGRLDLVPDASALPASLTEDSQFLSAYIASILAEPRVNHTQFAFPL